MRNVQTASWKVSDILSYFDETNFLDRFSKKTDVRFNGNPSNGRIVTPYGRKERRDESDSRFSYF